MSNKLNFPNVEIVWWKYQQWKEPTKQWNVKDWLDLNRHKLLKAKTEEQQHTEK